MGTGVRWLATAVGLIRLASGVSFLIAPLAANRMWGDPKDPGPTGRLLLRSMGYRDALIGGGLLAATARGDGAGMARWFLASGGADAADLVGGLADHAGLAPDQRRRGLGGAGIGIAVGIVGAVLAAAAASTRSH